jgi:hypothetical protein
LDTQVVAWLFARASLISGKRSPARIPMIAITTSNSISEKANIRALIGRAALSAEL